MAKSKKWTLNSEDWKLWFIRCIEWLAPVGMIYFPIVAFNLNDKGFQVSDFGIDSFVAGTIALYFVNRLYDLSKRLANGK